MNWDWLELLFPLPVITLLMAYVISTITMYKQDRGWLIFKVWLTPEFNSAMGVLRRWMEEDKLPKTLDLLEELESVSKGNIEILRALGSSNGYCIYRMIKARQKQNFWHRLWNRK